MIHQQYYEQQQGEEESEGGAKSTSSIDVDDDNHNNLANVKRNLQTFARLHREHRKVLGKRIFEAIAKLYGGDGNDGGVN